MFEESNTMNIQKQSSKITMAKGVQKMSIQNQSNRTTIRNLVIFTFIVLAIGWIGWGLDLLMGTPLSSEGLGILLWIASPLVLSLLLRTFAGDGWKDFGIKPNFKGNVGWYVVALLVYPLATAFILIIGRGFGLITFPNPSLSALVMVFHAFALAFLRDIIKNFFEEVAWRGYLAPKVYSLGLNDFVGHLIVGFIWGAWHIPYYLYYLDRAVLQDFTTLDLAMYIPLAILVGISWAFVYGELYLLTNSIWPAVLMHTVEDALLFTLVLDRHIQILPGTDWLISPMNGLICVAFFLMISVGLRYLRIRKIQPLDKAPLVVPV
jgi:membrane protease YdiL (CAAX protease family)